MTFSAPTTFVLTASRGLYSAAGTCFSAAAWTTKSTPSKRSTEAIAVPDVTDEEADPIIRADVSRELRLLELIATEHDHATGRGLSQDCPDEAPTKGPGSAGHHDRYVLEESQRGRGARVIHSLHSFSCRACPHGKGGSRKHVVRRLSVRCFGR